MPTLQSETEKNILIALEMAKKYTTKQEFRKDCIAMVALLRREKLWEQATEHMIPAYKQLSREECLEMVKKCKTIKECKKKYPDHYTRSYGQKWLKEPEFRDHLTFNKVKWTFQQRKEAAESCETNGEFMYRFKKIYEFSKRHGYLDAIRSHLHFNGNGFKRSKFVDKCKKSKGYGWLYILECSDSGFPFYKFGITSRTVNERHRHESFDIYDYSILLDIQAPAGFIYDLEKYLGRYFGEYKYQPEYVEEPTREVFACPRQLLDNLITQIVSNQLTPA